MFDNIDILFLLLIIVSSCLHKVKLTFHFLHICCMCVFDFSQDLFQPNCILVTVILAKCLFGVCSLKLGCLLGEGAFGMVVKADAVNLGGRKGTTVVAVKMLKGE